VSQEGCPESPFSLTDVRVLYELARREETLVSELKEDLGRDAGYPNRVLRGSEERRFIARRPLETDARREAR
jgi:DNA-binding MarR family transcriptional regulator